ncbi:MAG: hypothetical protein ACLQVD_13945 [Capsulimonadaceae bacterium]
MHGVLSYYRSDRAAGGVIASERFVQWIAMREARGIKTNRRERRIVEIARYRARMRNYFCDRPNVARILSVVCLGGLVVLSVSPHYWTTCLDILLAVSAQRIALGTLTTLNVPRHTILKNEHPSPRS